MDHARAAVLGGVLSQVPLHAQLALRGKIDLSKVGSKIGQQGPDFSLRDQNGATRNLSSIMGPKGAMLSSFVPPIGDRIAKRSWSSDFTSV